MDKVMRSQLICMLCFLLRELAVLQLSTQRSEWFLFLSWNLPKYWRCTKPPPSVVSTISPRGGFHPLPLLCKWIPRSPPSTVPTYQTWPTAGQGLSPPNIPCLQVKQLVWIAILTSMFMPCHSGLAAERVSVFSDVKWRQSYYRLTGGLCGLNEIMNVEWLDCVWHIISNQ